MLVAEFLAEALVGVGVRHVFGVGGANIEDVFVAIQRRRPKIRAVLGKHEHGGGTAADAYARISSGLGVVLATSGGGAMNLVHSLAEARASRVPLLAIVGEPPTDLQGRGAFQDTSDRGSVDAAKVYAAASKTCVRVEDVEALPGLFSEAVASAFAEPPGPAVLLLAKDRQRATLNSAPLPGLNRTPPRGPSAESIERAAALLDAGPVLVIAGDEVARAQATGELASLVERLGALVAVTPDGRDAFDNRDARFLGVVGSMGHAQVREALALGPTLLVLGTRLPLLARQGLEPALSDSVVVSLGRERPFLEFRRHVELTGDLRLGMAALTSASRVHGPAPQVARPLPLALPVRPPAASKPLDSASALQVIDRAIPDGSVVLVDAGNTGASATHLLRAPRGGRWLLALGMAGMGYTFGGAVGAALASGRRCFALAGDGAFFMHGLELHTAVEHRLPISYVVFDNSAHGMCLVRERLLLKTDADYNAFRRASLAAGVGAMFPGLPVCACRTAAELEQALARAADSPGPAFISVELSGVEVPPFLAFQEAGGAAFSVVERGGAR
jgi:acetolactate synthase I/II/III large subunit